MKKLVGMLTGLFLLVGMAGTPDNAATFTSDHCDPACGPQPNGFAAITGIDNGGGAVSLTITPPNGNGLSEVLYGLAPFTFTSLQNQAITFDFGLNAALFDVSNSATNTANPGAIGQDG